MVGRDTMRARRCSLVVLGATLLASGPAVAQRALLADLDSPPELRDEAGAVSLLVRSMLAAGRRPLVPRHEIGLGLKALGGAGTTERHALIVDTVTAGPLMDELAADRLLVGTLSRQGKRLAVATQVLGPKGAPLAEISATAPNGEVWQLARDVAQRLAPRIDATFVDLPATPLGHLRPFVTAAAALAKNDAAGAARALELGNPAAAAKLSGAREIGEAVWQNTNLPFGDRIKAALATGNGKSAAALADEALKEDPRDITARAARIRALTALGDTAAAERELAELKSARNHPTVALARAELAMRAGADRDERDEAVQPLLAKSNPSLLRAALAFIVGTPAGSFGDKVETAAVQAAEKVAAQEPGLASQIASRAIAGGVEVPRAIKLVQTNDLGMDDLAVIKARLDAGVPGGDPSLTEKFTGEISERRETAREIRLSQTGARSTAARTAVADRLLPILGQIERLQRPGFSRVLLVPLTGSGQPFYAVFAVRPDRLRDGLNQALTGAPYSLATADPPAGTLVDAESPTEDRLMALASDANADMLLGYQIRAGALDADARIRLLLFDVAGRKAFVADGSATGGAFTRLNLIPVGGVGALVLGAVAFILLGVLRGGVTVHIKRDPGAKEEMFSIVVSRTPRAPAVASAEDYIERTRKVGPTHKRNQATMVGTETRFPGIGTGVWYVHLFGTYTKGGENRLLESGLMQEVVVQSRKTAWASFNLEPSAADFHVLVYDGDLPVSGAMVWVDDGRGKAIATVKEGLAVLAVPRGNHHICVEARGLVVERAVSVHKTISQELKVNLAWERRVDDVSRALEGAPEDADAALDLERRRRAGDPSVPPRAKKSPAVADTMMAVDASGADAPGAAESADGIYVGGGIAPALAAAAAAAQATAVSRPSAMAGGLGSGGIDAGGGATSGLRRYRRLAELGRGAMGVVYRAKDLVLERDVALKIMSDEIRTHPAVAEMFFQEAKSLAALNHANVVTVFDQGRDGDEIYLVMELVEGRTLADIIAVNGKLSLSMALDLADQLCAGMGYAHGKRIIHRDIKPANVFVTPQGNVKIGDFGLSRVVRELRITKTEIRGTPLYMSPEQILGKDIDFRADLYSIGCTIYELLTGRPPFTQGEVLYHHLHTPVEPPSSLAPGVPPELDQLVMACLAKDKNARIASAEHIRSALRPLRLRFAS